MGVTPRPLPSGDPSRAGRHAQFQTREIGWSLHVAGLREVGLPGAQIDRLDDLDAHGFGDGIGIVLADRAVENLAHVIVVAEHIARGQHTIFRELLFHLEGGHRAHLEIAALERGNLGALPEERGVRMDRNGELPRQVLLDAFLELLQRLVEPVALGRGGGDPELRLREGRAAQHQADAAAAASMVKLRFVIIVTLRVDVVMSQRSG